MSIKGNVHGCICVYCEDREREALAFRAMVKHGLQYHPPDAFNPHHRISNRHGEFLAEGGTALEAVEKASKILEAKG